MHNESVTLILGHVFITRKPIYKILVPSENWTTLLVYKNKTQIHCLDIRDIKLCQIRHPDVRIRYPETSASRTPKGFTTFFRTPQCKDVDL